MLNGGGHNRDLGKGTLFLSTPDSCRSLITRWRLLWLFSARQTGVSCIPGLVRTKFKSCGVAAGYGEHEGNLAKGPVCNYYAITWLAGLFNRNRDLNPFTIYDQVEPLKAGKIPVPEAETF